MKSRWSSDSSTNETMAAISPAASASACRRRVVAVHGDLGVEVLEQVARQPELREDDQVGVLAASLADELVVSLEVLLEQRRAAARSGPARHGAEPWPQCRRRPPPAARLSTSRRGPASGAKSPDVPCQHRCVHGIGRRSDRARPRGSGGSRAARALVAPGSCTHGRLRTGWTNSTGSRKPLEAEEPRATRRPARTSHTTISLMNGSSPASKMRACCRRSPRGDRSGWSMTNVESSSSLTRARRPCSVSSARIMRTHSTTSSDVRQWG